MPLILMGVEGCCGIEKGTNRREEKVHYCPVPKRNSDGSCVCEHAGSLIEVGGILRMGCRATGDKLRKYSMYIDLYVGVPETIPQAQP